MFTEQWLGNDAVLECRVLDDGTCSLSCRKQGNVLVEYRDGRRIVRGRATPYAFKSIEKLRYDFERDAEDALRRG